MINVLTANVDKFLLLSSVKVKVQLLSNIKVFYRYFVYETLSKLSFDDLLFGWILYCLSFSNLRLQITSSSNFKKKFFLRYQRDNQNP